MIGEIIGSSFPFSLNPPFASFPITNFETVLAKKTCRSKNSNNYFSLHFCFQLIVLLIELPSFCSPKGRTVLTAVSFCPKTAAE
jgi:hypothetical protein